MPRRMVVLVPYVTALTVGAATQLAPATAREGSGSLAQLAGERVIYSYRGLHPPASLISQIKAGRAAGVILFSDNIAGDGQIRGVAGELQRAAAQSPAKLPLLLMTDQEGGAVRRLPGAPTRSEKQIGDSAHPALAAIAAGRRAGANLKGVGMDVNLAPVLDVYRRSGNFIDRYGRSYSSNPKRVARLGADFVRAQQKAGVAATAKHFPGLGAARADENTDATPVSLRVRRASLRTVDELPYVSAVRAGVKLVMLSWAVYPALDRHRPAGLSRTIVQRELRERLGFKGVTITDALEAGALRSYGSTSNRAVLAARAGMDLVLCSSQDPAQGAAAVKALARAMSRGTLDAASFEAAADRVRALRERRAG